MQRFNKFKFRNIKDNGRLYFMSSFTHSLNMDSLMNSGEYIDNTEKIRQLKHSNLINADVEKICLLKQTNPKMRVIEEEKFKQLCVSSCPFLYTNYQVLFNKLVNDELNLKMLAEFLSVLREIESSTIDQYDASVKIGTILRDIYISKPNETTIKPVNESKNISWKQYSAARNEIIKNIMKTNLMKK